MSDSQKPERDWAKEPYNTWDTLAAMRLPPMPADKGDMSAIAERLSALEEKIDRILNVLTANPPS